MLLVTDDDLCQTNRMRAMARIPGTLADLRSVLDSGVTVVFRVRDSVLAQYCSLALNRNVESSNDPLPTLRYGDVVNHIYQLHIGGESDNRIYVAHLPYSPD